MRKFMYWVRSIDWYVATPFRFSTMADAQIYLARDYGISADFITAEFVEGI